MTTFRLFCSDLDGTLLGNPATTEQFREAWMGLVQAPLLCFNSWRNILNMADLVAAGELPAPDYLIGGMGTEIVDFRNKQTLDDYTRDIARDWDAAAINDLLATIPGAERLPDEVQTPYKLSWLLPHADDDIITALREEIAARAIQATVIYTGACDLHILPRRADKGRALGWLCTHLEIDLTKVLVAGDQGSDASMYRLPGTVGILVENAQPELLEATSECSVYRSDGRMAAGVLDGLCHFGILCTIPETTRIAIPPALESAHRLYFDLESFTTLDDSERALLNEAYDAALIALRKNITPLGFSACSLDDNEITGTDVNYRSVWARDGCIATIDSSHLDDPDIRACQLATLQTLLAHTADNGQVPANVRIDSGEPDYSGVGGICAIDSGLWLVIACYHYVNATGDLDFLGQCLPTVREIMRWLLAHDANRDGLLEIPEASDWTDLFGRSYNVLYDEMLWYRSTICYGHLLQLAGDSDASAEQMHASQLIRNQILKIFWPTTSPGDIQSEMSFADSQYSLGDARYLLAEVSPFKFSWRCDVIGNLLGFLFNLLDAGKARSALTFMWGVGVNQPWPVTNLYPVVQSGDPDWKPYYTVNLLNLPHHYHNGGIWPFIGGMWIRFLYHLGEADVASRELVRLAECCRQGRNHTWEFNEWYHGITGRPMGKAYQAWSAASFIRACHVLHVGDDSA